MFRRVIFVLAVTILVALLPGCFHVENGAWLLGDTSWELTAYGDNKHPDTLIPGTRITLNFSPDADSGGGSAGCNSYGGACQVSNGTISFETINQTEMYCLEPPGIMQQEEKYLRLLASSDKYSVNDSQLKITCDDGQVLVFQRTGS